MYTTKVTTVTDWRAEQRRVVGQHALRGDFLDALARLRVTVERYRR